jgi:hypothetical protein
MDFQLCSDLHLETRGGLRAPVSSYPVRSAPILIVCGDTYPFVRPDFKEVVRRVAEPFDLVLFVPGNHEFYGSDMTVDRAMEEACYGIGNVAYMNKRSINIRAMQFIGTTLWVDNPKDSASANIMSDYSQIKNFTPKSSYALHKDHKKFIARSIKDAKRAGNVGAVVISHHVPDDRLAYDITSREPVAFPYYFARDMKELTSDPFIKVWCHGHSHEAYRTKLDKDGAIFASNALGYPGEKTGYCRNALFNLTSK